MRGADRGRDREGRERRLPRGGGGARGAGRGGAGVDGGEAHRPAGPRGGLHRRPRSSTPLLLVFIVVELLSAVRTTLAERQLLAEPFLIVGIIASIKEIVVLSVKAPDYVGTDKLEDTIWLIGVLTFTIVALALSTLLMRRKEREPSEGDGSGPDAAHERQTRGVLTARSPADAVLRRGDTDTRPQVSPFCLTSPAWRVIIVVSDLPTA